MEKKQENTEARSGLFRRGFASLSAERRKQIARAGGLAAHKKGTAHKFTPEEAKYAGRKGGKTTSSNRKYMAEIGKKGGDALHAKNVNGSMSRNKL